MKLRHFEALCPVCPVCRTPEGGSALSLTAEAGRGDDVDAGVLVCREGCGSAFPILEGAPILMADLAGWVAANLHLLSQSRIRGAAAEALIGAASGPDSAFAIVRQQQSTYGHAHYGDLSDAGGPAGLDALMTQARASLVPGAGAVLDLGCAVGGSSFGLAAAQPGLVLGVDVNWPLIAVGRSALASGEVSFPLRRGGMSYERRTGPLRHDGAERVDFWVADALALPFLPAAFGNVIALNLIDCVADPARLVTELGRVLAPGGGFALATPFDWASHATPVSSWIDGPETLIEQLKIAGLKLAQDVQVPWQLRLHDRATMSYSTNMFIGTKT